MKHTIEGQIQILSHSITLIEASNIPVELKKSMGDGLRDSQETLSHQSERINALEEALKSLNAELLEALKDAKILLDFTFSQPVAKSVISTIEKVNSAIAKAENLL